MISSCNHCKTDAHCKFQGACIKKQAEQSRRLLSKRLIDEPDPPKAPVIPLFPNKDKS